MSKITAAITGVGGYVPEYVLTNQELEKLVETTDEWILSRTGIKERRILKGEGLGTSYMCEHAVRDLLAKTNTDPLDIDLIIVATVTLISFSLLRPIWLEIWWDVKMLLVTMFRLLVQVFYTPCPMP